MKNTKFKLNQIFVLIILLAFGQGFAAWNGVSMETATEVDGYYIIDSEEKLAWFAAQTNTSDNNSFLSKNAILTKDLDMGGKLWTPIAVGNGNSGKRIFSGIFDGKGHSISNLYISAEELMNNHGGSTFYAQNLGFIGCFKGTLKNLNIVNIEVHGYGQGGAWKQH